MGVKEFSTGFAKGSSPTWAQTFDLGFVNPSRDVITLRLQSKGTGLKKLIGNRANDAEDLELPARDVASGLEAPFKCEYALPTGGKLTVALEAARLSLWDAIESGSVDTVKDVLKESGDDLNAELGAHKWSPLMRLAYELSDSVVETILPRLVEAGAELSAVNDEGKNVLFFAVASGKRKTTALLLRLLGKGAVVSSVDCFGNTPLHFCTDEEIAYALVGAGFAASTQNKDGNTPLHLAYAASAPPGLLAALACKRVVLNKDKLKPLECKGRGVMKALPFGDKDPSLSAKGGITINEGGTAAVPNYW